VDIHFSYDHIGASETRYDKTARNFLAADPFGPGGHSGLNEDED
jgi:hypothetical protein